MADLDREKTLGQIAEWWLEAEFGARFPSLPDAVLSAVCARLRVAGKHDAQRSGPVYRWGDLLHELQAEVHSLDQAGERARAEAIAGAMIGLISLGSPHSPPQPAGSGEHPVD
ncbi:MAG: hypothetical protein ACYCZN_01190 [Candidatus Dormibacteria bacterium]